MLPRRKPLPPLPLRRNGQARAQLKYLRQFHHLLTDAHVQRNGAYRQLLKLASKVSGNLLERIDPEPVTLPGAAAGEPLSSDACRPPDGAAAESGAAEAVATASAEGGGTSGDGQAGARL